MDYNKYLSYSAKRRQGSILRELTKQIAFCDGQVYPLSGGIPIPSEFPFKETILTARDGTVIKLDEETMEIAQQYGVTDGYQPLLELLRDYQIRLHNPPSPDWTLIMTSGAQEGICLAFEMFINEGDYVIGGDHCFSSALDIFRPLGAKYIGVEQDKHGMIPDSLRNQLQDFDPTSRNRLKLIYIVSNGGNPESYTLLASRRKEIYEIACEFDLLILEDDPYHFIVFDQPKLPCSFLSLDVDGRVIRCDSLSKVISPGIRLGFVTAARPISEKFVFKLQVSSLQANSFTQVIIYKLLTAWGFDGYIKNGQRICEAYRKQKTLACKSAEKWLKNLAHWEEPSGGMFMWIRVKDVEDTTELVEKARKKKAFFAPGRAFRYDNSPSPYVRVSFSNATVQHFDGGFEILAECIEEYKSRPPCNGHSNGHSH